MLIGTNFRENLIGIQTLHSSKSIWKCRLWNGVHLSRPQWVNIWVKSQPPGVIDLLIVSLALSHTRLGCLIRSVANNSGIDFTVVKCSDFVYENRKRTNNKKEICRAAIKCASGAVKYMHIIFISTCPIQHLDRLVSSKSWWCGSFSKSASHPQFNFLLYTSLLAITSLRSILEMQIIRWYLHPLLLSMPGIISPCRVSRKYHFLYPDTTLSVNFL